MLAKPSVLLRVEGADFTSAFRSLSSALRGNPERARALFAAPSAFDAWSARWLAEHAAQGSDPAVGAEAMDAVNPVYIPRNHLVEDALTAGSNGDMGPFDRLLGVITRPFEERPGLAEYARMVTSKEA